VGCGVCPYTAFLVREGYLRGQVVGVDQMPEILGRAREVFERAQASHPLVLGTALRLPFADASFEHVFCNDALHWIKGWRRALNEMCRVLAPGGRLFVCYSVKFTRTLITERGIIEELAKHGIKPAFVSFDAVGSQTPRTIVTGCKGGRAEERTKCPLLAFNRQLGNHLIRKVSHSQIRWLITLTKEANNVMLNIDFEPHTFHIPSKGESDNARR
jgi:SAM-dependent methyltransferase